jgi:hypothetical protein
MKMNFFGEGLKEISSLRVFYATIIGLIVGGVISSVTEYYTGLGTKPVLAIVQKSSTGAGTNVIAGLGNRYDLNFPNRACCSQVRSGLLMLCRFLRCGFGCFCDDGNDCNAVGYRCVRADL